MAGPLMPVPPACMRVSAAGRHIGREPLNEVAVYVSGCKPDF
jgi:hypothetical protein